MDDDSIEELGEQVTETEESGKERVQDADESANSDEDEEEDEAEKEAEELKKKAKQAKQLDKDRLEELRVQLTETEARHKERVQDADERTTRAVSEAEDLKEKLEKELKFAGQDTVKQAAAQKVKLEESAKLIAFLQKETKKLKSANDKAKKEMKKAKETNDRLVKANESAGQSFEMLNSQSGKLGGSTKSINDNIDKFKSANTKLREDLKSRQAFYNAEAQIRLQYQKTLAQILDVFQDNCKDPDLVEDVVCIALECESEAKALLAAAEAGAPGL
jgi:hypothetical protein